MSKINAGIAMVKVLESWGIDHIYGIPGRIFQFNYGCAISRKNRNQLHSSSS